MSFKEQAKKFSVDASVVEIEGVVYTIKKFSAFWMLNIQKIATRQGEDDPATLAAVMRGGIAEDLTDLSDEQVLSVPHINELCQEVLKYNGLLEKPKEVEGTPEGKKRKSSKTKTQ